MNTVFANKKISGILGILPEKSYQFTDEMDGGDTPRNTKIAKNMGYGQRYRVKPGTTTGDLCIYGMKYLLEKEVIKREEIGAVIVLTFTPDYYVPQVSNLIQGECDLPQDILTLDIWDGCAGYINGLFNAFMYADKIKDKKVLLFTGDIINRGGGETFTNPPYGGDGAAITIIENTDEKNEIPLLWETDGKNRDMITFSEGAFFDIFHENKLNKSDAQTDPNASFRYFQTVIPEVVKRFASINNIALPDIDRFFFIQANKLSVKKFADSLELPYEKVRMDLVEKYGDMSAVLNPIGIVDELSDEIRDNSFDTVIVGYGAGMRWGATKIKFEKGTYLEMINSDL